MIDFREVNKRIKADSYPLPSIEEILQEASGYRYYLCLDLNWGFWNLPLEESSKELTAFLTHKGLFQFNVLPFGMENYPVEFQRYMDSIFGHLYQRNVRIHIDDIVIFADSFDELMQLLEEVLDAAVKGVFFNLLKCDILPVEAPLLGHCLSAAGYRCFPQRIEALWSAR